MAVGFFGKQMLKNLIKGGKQKTTGKEVVNPFKFKPSKSKLEKTVKKLEIDTAQQKGRTKKIIYLKLKIPLSYLKSSWT